jgi:hypothetical protein
MIRNAGGGTLSWDVSSSCAWTQASPSNGNSTGEIDDVVVSVDITALTHASFLCEIQVADAQAVNSPRSIMLTLHLGTVFNVPSEHPTIQDGIDATSIPGDTVIVADGTYTGPGNKDLDFRGKDVIVRSANGPQSCIIDCEGNGRAAWFRDFETPVAMLDGFTIQNGSGEGGGPTNYGGAILLGAGVTVANCFLINNTASSYGGGLAVAGGISIGGGNPTVRGCVFVGNTGWKGGAITTFADTTIIDCVMTGNHALSGGGLWTGLAVFTPVTNCLIADNTADGDGGGINLGRGRDITGCTIAGNSAGGLGDGIYLRNGNQGTATITNSIIWGNGTQQIVFDSITPVISYSNVQGGWPGTGNTNADPMFLNTDMGDYRPSPGSPCIDAGDNTVVPEGIDTDLAGNTRFADDPDTVDTGNGTPPIVDMGAYEFAGVGPCIWDCGGGGNGTVDTTDFLVLIGQWGQAGVTCDFGLGAPGVSTADFLAVLGNWGPCP